MPKFISQEGDAFSVDQKDRHFSGATIADALKVAPLTGKLTAGASGTDEPIANAGNMFVLVAAAGNAAGSRTCTGARIGDRVVGVINLTDGTNDAADFETTITVVDKIQQTATNHTNDVEIVYLVRP